MVRGQLIDCPTVCLLLSDLIKIHSVYLKRPEGDLIGQEQQQREEKEWHWCRLGRISWSICYGTGNWQCPSTIIEDASIEKHLKDEHRSFHVQIEECDLWKGHSCRPSSLSLAIVSHQSMLEICWGDKIVRIHHHYKVMRRLQCLGIGHHQLKAKKCNSSSLSASIILHLISTFSLKFLSHSDSV